MLSICIAVPIFELVWASFTRDKIANSKKIFLISYILVYLYLSRPNFRTLIKNI